MTKEITAVRVEAIAKEIYASEPHLVTWAWVPKGTKAKILKYVRLALEIDARFSK